MGERRVRVIDLGSGNTYGKDAPNTIASEADHWHEVTVDPIADLPIHTLRLGLRGRPISSSLHLR